MTGTIELHILPILWPFSAIYKRLLTPTVNLWFLFLWVRKQAQAAAKDTVEYLFVIP